MIGEIDFAGIFVSPLLACMIVALVLRVALSRVLEATGFYRLVWQRPLFDTSLFILLIGCVFAVLRLFTTH